MFSNNRWLENKKLGSDFGDFHDIVKNEVQKKAKMPSNVIIAAYTNRKPENVRQIISPQIITQEVSYVYDDTQWQQEEIFNQELPSTSSFAAAASTTTTKQDSTNNLGEKQIRMYERNRITSKCLTSIDKYYSTFDFKACLDEKMKKAAAIEFDASSYAQPFEEGHEFSVGDVARMYHNLFVKHNVSFQGRHEFMDLTAKLFPNHKVPTYSSRVNTTLSMNGILEPIKPYLEWHACPTGDTVYVAQHADDKECKICGKARTNRCTVSYCDSPNEAHNCVHYAYRTPKKTVFYKPITEILRTLLKYDAFRYLISYKNTSRSKYDDLMNCPIPKKHLKEMDARWERFVQEHVNEYFPIERNDACTIEHVRLKANGNILIPINILLSINYDGIQTFKRRSNIFTPLIVSILNLPPFLRVTVGVGMFTISVFTGGDSVKADAKILEDFIFLNCLIKELLMLKDGVIIEDLLEYGGKQYFLQVRLILHLYDTRALEGIMHVQAAGAYAACPLCGLISGGLKRELDKVVYLGHRVGLPLSHYLRRIGQGCMCCPRNFHTNYFSGEIVPKDKKLPLNQPYVVPNWNTTVSSRILKSTEFRTLEPCEGTEAHRKACKELATLGELQFVWFHEDVIKKDAVIKHLQPHLYYHYADYRPLPTKIRVTTKEYIQHGEYAFDNKQPYKGIKGIAFFALLPYFDKETQLNWDPFHVLMNDSRALIDLLKGTRVISGMVDRYCEHFYFNSNTQQVNSPMPLNDEGHKNDERPNKRQKKISTDILEPNKQIEKDLTTSSNQASNSKKTPTVTEAQKTDQDTSSSKLPTRRLWEITNPMQNLFDACVEGLYVPKCNRYRFEVRRPFQLTGQLSGMGKIQMFGLLGNLLCSVIVNHDSNFPKQYLYFLLMFSSDVRALLNEHLSEKDIDNLYDRTMETVATAEGLWPHSELLFTVHQLTDLPKFMKNFGGVKNWWTLPGERAAAQTKKKVPSQGGSKYDRVAFEKQQEDEYAKATSFFSCDVASMLAGTKSRKQVKDENNTIITSSVDKLLKSCFSWLKSKTVNGVRAPFYDNMLVVLSDKKEKTPFSFEDYELEAYHDMLNTYIKEVILKGYGPSSHQDDHVRIAKLYRGSPYLRLYFMYQKSTKSVSKKTSFYEWLCNLVINHGENVVNKDFTVDMDSIDTDEELLHNLNHGWSKSAANLAHTYVQPRTILASDAQVGGTQFSGRGYLFREECKPVKEHGLAYGSSTHGYVPSKSCNSLEIHWNEDIQKDSWCKYESSTPGFTSSYAQLNCFFQIKYRRDLLLNDLCFASVTPRKTERFGFDNRLDIVSLSLLHNYSQFAQPFILLDAVRLYAVAHIPIAGFEKVNTTSDRSSYARFPKENEKELSTRKYPLLKPYLQNASSHEYRSEPLCLLHEVAFLCLIPLDL
jgi:hypothetical protein